MRKVRLFAAIATVALTTVALMVSVTVPAAAQVLYGYPSSAA
jgi:hypothetical protein